MALLDGASTSWPAVIRPSSSRITRSRPPSAAHRKPNAPAPKGRPPGPCPQPVTTCPVDPILPASRLAPSQVRSSRAWAWLWMGARASETRARRTTPRSGSNRTTIARRPPTPPPLPWATVQRKAEAVAGAGCVRVMQGALERKRSEKSSARGDATRPNRCLLPSPSSLHRPSPHERTNERTPRYDCSAERRAKAPQIREPPLRVDGGPERSRPVRSRRSANIMHRKGREKGANGFYGFCTHMSGSG